MWPPHRSQLPQRNELMSFCGSEPVMNSYLEQSHGSKPDLKLVGHRALSPAEQDHLLYPLPRRGQPAQPWKGLSWTSGAIQREKTLSHPSLFFRQFPMVISPPEDFVIVTSEREDEEDGAVEQEGRAGAAVGEQKGKGRDGQQAGCVGSEQLQMTPNSTEALQH